MLVTRLLYLYCLSYVSILKTKTAIDLSLYVAKRSRFVTAPVTFFFMHCVTPPSSIGAYGFQEQLSII